MTTKPQFSRKSYPPPLYIRPWDQKNLVLNSIEKIKPVFLYFPKFVCFLNWTGQNSDLTAFTSKIYVFCRSEWTKRKTPWKWTLTFFKYKNEYHKQLPSFLFPSWFMVLKLPKIVYFLLICADFSKKSKSIEEIYLYPSKRPHHALLEHSLFCRGLSNSSRDTEEWNIKKKMLTQQRLNETHQLQKIVSFKF